MQQKSADLQSSRVPPEGGNKAEPKGLEPTPEFQKHLDDFSERKAARQEGAQDQQQSPGQQKPDQQGLDQQSSDQQNGRGPSVDADPVRRADPTSPEQPSQQDRSTDSSGQAQSTQPGEQGRSTDSPDATQPRDSVRPTDSSRPPGEPTQPAAETRPGVDTATESPAADRNGVPSNQQGSDQQRDRGSSADADPARPADPTSPAQSGQAGQPPDSPEAARPEDSVRRTDSTSPDRPAEPTPPAPEARHGVDKAMESLAADRNGAPSNQHSADLQSSRVPPEGGDKAEPNGLESTPEYQKHLDDFSERKAARQESPPDTQQSADLQSSRVLQPEQTPEPELTSEPEPTPQPTREPGPTASVASDSSGGGPPPTPPGGDSPLPTPPSDGPSPGRPADHSPPSDTRPQPVVSSFLPPTGDGQVQPRAVAADGPFPGWQDDNGTRDPMGDYHEAVKKFEADGTPLSPEHEALHDALQVAPPPGETLYKGGQRPESVIDGWKSGLANVANGGEPPRLNLDAASTSTSSTIAMVYADASDHASQRLGKPEGLDKQINPAKAVDPSDLVPGHEHIAPEMDFAHQYAEHREQAVRDGNTERVEQLDRLHDTVSKTGKLEDGRLPAVPFHEGTRRDALEETILSGNYELAGLLDTRPGHEAELGDVRAVKLPNGDLPGPGVYPVWRPVSNGT
jgi:hypothetical protein